MAGFPMMRRCCCRGGGTDPDCTPAKYTFPECAIAKPGGGFYFIATCLQTMTGFVTLVFEDDEYGEWSRASGTYPAAAWQCSDETDYSIEMCRRWGEALGRVESCTGWGVQIECDEEEEELVVVVSLSCEDDGDSGPYFWGIGRLPLPVDLESGFTITLTEFSPTCVPGDVWCPKLVGGSVTFFGTPCEEITACETAGPTADFTLAPAGTGGGCLFLPTNLSTAGDCDIEECYWSDGVVGCDRTEFVGLSGCGEQSGSLSLLVVDKKGCTDEVTKPFSCCNCDDGESVCDSSKPTLMLARYGESGIITDCPITSTTFPDNFYNCSQYRTVRTCDLTIAYSWPRRHACGSFAMAFEFIGDWDGGAEFSFVVGPGGPDPDTAYFEFTIPGVKIGYARNIFLRAYLIAVDGDVDEEPEELPVGCSGPVDCVFISNVAYYPGNSDWAGSEDDCSWTEYTCLPGCDC